MKLKTLYRLIFGVLIVCNGILLFLWIKAPKPPSMEGPKQEIIARLKLDDKQISQYEALIHEHRKSIRSCNERMQKAKQKHFKGLKESNPQLNQAYLNEMMEIEKEINSIHFEHFLALKLLLRQDQLPAFNVLMDDIAKLLAPKGPPRK